MSKKLILLFPKRPLTTEDIIKYVKKLKIAHFRGVFSRDNLPNNPYKYECAIINLDTIRGKGTHWVAYYKNNDKIVYFDSFGDLSPPYELQTYFKDYNIKYNYKNYQKFNTVNCGQLCLNFLYCMNQNKVLNKTLTSIRSNLTHNAARIGYHKHEWY